MTNQAFIDGQNLTLGTTTSENPWKIDLFKFREYLHSRYNIEKAYYFVGCMNDDLQDLYDRLQEAGFILVFRSHGEGLMSPKKGNVDTDIVFMMMRNFHEDKTLEKIFLISGDGDYYKTIKYLKENDKLGKILFPAHRKASSLYKRLGGTYYDYLDSKDVKKKIKLSGWHK